MTDDVVDLVPRLMQDLQAISAWEECQSSKPVMTRGEKAEVFFALGELYERLENLEKAVLAKMGKLTLAVDNTAPRSLRNQIYSNLPSSRDLFDAILERNADEDRDEDPPDLTPAS